MDPTVQSAQPPGYCGAIADELRRIADDLDTIGQLDLPEPRMFQIAIQPGGKTNADIRGAVDALGRALLGMPGKAATVGGEAWHTVEGRRGQIEVKAYRELPEHDRDIELAALRARVAELEARDDGQGFSREADDPTPVSPARVPLHTGAVTDGGLVDESEGELVHMDSVEGESMCGLGAVTPHRGSWVWATVTCADCRAAGAA